VGEEHASGSPKMAEHRGNLCERLKRLGFTQENQMRLYGQEFVLRSDPIIMGKDLVFVDAVQKESGQLKRVRIPLTILKMVNEEPSAA
jgi:hypothetical protein